MVNDTVKAVIEFENGKKINLKLYPSAAPITVKNFCTLADSGYYDGLCFHRVIPNFMVQGGGFTSLSGKLTEKKAGAQIKGEFSSNGVKNPLKHTLGAISMARTNVKDSATGQFFICVTATPFLDGEYAAFGECADEQSQKVAVEMSKVKTHSLPSGFDDVPCEAVIIKSIRTEA